MAVNLLNLPDAWEWNVSFPWDPIWQTPTPYWNSSEGRWEFLNTTEYPSTLLYQIRTVASEDDSWLEGTITLIESVYMDTTELVKLIVYEESDPNTLLLELPIELNTPVDFYVDGLMSGVTYILAIASISSPTPNFVYNVSAVVVPVAAPTTTTTTQPPVILEVCLTVTDSANNTGSECVALPACAPPTTTTTTTQPPVSIPWMVVCSTSSGEG